MKPQLILVGWGTERFYSTYPNRLPSAVNKDQFKQVVLNLFPTHYSIHKPNSQELFRVIGNKQMRKTLVNNTRYRSQSIPQKNALPHLFERFYKTMLHVLRHTENGFRFGYQRIYYRIARENTCKSKLDVGTAFEILLPLT